MRVKDNTFTRISMRFSIAVAFTSIFSKTRNGSYLEIPQGQVSNLVGVHDWEEQGTTTSNPCYGVSAFWWQRAVNAQFRFRQS